MLQFGTPLCTIAAMFEVGNKEIWNLRKNAFLCSSVVPATAVLKCYDWAVRNREEGNCVIGGFHSQIEKDVLHFLIKGTQPLILALARGLKVNYEPAISKALSDGRLLIISPFPKEIDRVTIRTAGVRNRMMIDLADTVFVGFSSPGGKLETLLKDVTKPVIRL